MDTIDLIFNSGVEESILKWDNEQKNFFCHLKKINITPIPDFINVYDKKTDKQIIFKKFGRQLDIDSNVLSWIFKSVQGSKYPVKLKIIND